MRSGYRWLLFVVFIVVVLAVALHNSDRSLFNEKIGLAPAASTASPSVDAVGPDLDAYGYPCPLKGCAFDFYGNPCQYEDCHLLHLEWGHYPIPD